MRVAVMIIALCLTMILGVQSCAITAGGALLGDEGTKGAGSMGLLLAVIFVVGAAFSWGFPRFAGTLFLAGGVLALLAIAGTPFVDLAIWGCVSIGLAVMAFFGAREVRRQAPAVQPVLLQPSPPPPHWVERQPAPLLLSEPEGMQPSLAPLPPNPARRQNQLIAAGGVTVGLVGLSLGAFSTGTNMFAPGAARHDGPAGVVASDPVASGQTGTADSGGRSSSLPPSQDPGGEPSIEANGETSMAMAPGPDTGGASDKAVPTSFRGRWDDDVSDGCDGREAALTITTDGDAVYAYEIESTVMKVTRRSPNAVDVSVAGYDEGTRYDDTYKLELGLGGRTLKVNGSVMLRKCPG